ncbi:Uncharacterized protein dnm_016620 [Desulfonema magnum]|uniref:Uncharacterized protein n=1 Tax=Desulfonema magnum TaxID=45655 RepID=A0A975GLH6_9BACT|nr:Uncharacterized protein dnm_016620 [Desulfonema magnum]
MSGYLLKIFSSADYVCFFENYPNIPARFSCLKSPYSAHPSYNY